MARGKLTSTMVVREGEKRKWYPGRRRVLAHPHLSAKEFKLNIEEIFNGMCIFSPR